MLTVELGWAKWKRWLIKQSLKSKRTIICRISQYSNKPHWLPQPDFPTEKTLTVTFMSLHTLTMFSLCSYIFCLGDAFLLKKGARDEWLYPPCTRKLAKWKWKIKVKDLSLFIVVYLYATKAFYTLFINYKLAYSTHTNAY